MNLTTPNRRRAFFVNVAGGWLSNCILIVQGILFIPLYLQELDSELYGYWLATGGVLTWFAMVDLGAAGITQQRCASAYARNDLQSVVDYFWHGLAVMAAVGAIFAGLILYFSGKIPRWIGVPFEHTELVSGCFLLAAASVYCFLFISLLRSFCAGLQRNEVHSAVDFLGNLTSITVIYITLKYLNWGLWSIPAGAFFKRILELSVNSLYVCYLISKVEQKTIWQKSIFRDYRKATTALLAAKSTSSFVGSLPNILLARTLGPEFAVIYTITIRPLDIIGAFVNRVNSSLFSTFSHFYSAPNIEPQRFHDLGRKICLFFGGGCYAALLLYSLFNEAFVRIWVGSDQFAGQAFTGLAAVATFLRFKSNLFEGLAANTGAISEASWIKCLENSATSILIIIGLLYFGMNGIPGAMIISAAIIQIPQFLLIKRHSSVLATGLMPLNWYWVYVGISVSLVIFISSKF